MQLLAETISVGARTSPLATAQIKEVLELLHVHHPDVDFEIYPILTTGDLDKKTSLRLIGKTDFFTKEIDLKLLSKDFRIAIHSAKDLPEHIPEGLSIIALTRGLDSSDSLVMRQEDTIQTLKKGALIATSSLKREEAVKLLRPDLKFCDLRGTIEERLKKLSNGEADGVVVAEAALIRLKLKHLNRIRLPGKTTPLQGQLAIVARSDDLEMHSLFSCLDTRKKCLYLGIDLPDAPHDTIYVHAPIITIIPRDPHLKEIADAFREIPRYTHVIFTSKNAVRLFFMFLPHFNYSIDHLNMIAVGKKTAELLTRYHVEKITLTENETAEGVVNLLETLELENSYLFWPHSALSRPLISYYLNSKKIPHRSCIIYDTQEKAEYPFPSLDTIDAIMFTSPSTVTAFLKYYKSLPKDKELIAIGPITKETIELYTTLNYNAH